jgi:hypothetical protein
MIEPQSSIEIDQVVVSVDVIVGLVKPVKRVGAFSGSNVEMVISTMMVRGDATTSSVSLRSPLSSSGNLAAGASVWGWGGWSGFPRGLLSLAAATIAFSLDFRGDRWDKRGGEVGVGEFRGVDDGGVWEEGRRGGEMSKSLDGVVEVTFLRPFQFGNFLEGKGEDGCQSAGFLLELGLKLRTALEDVILRAETFFELLSGSVKYRGAESDRGQVGAGEFSAFLVFSNVFEAVVNPPVHYAEGFVQDDFDPVLEQAEGEVD